MQRLLASLLPPSAAPPTREIESESPQREELRIQIAATAMATCQVTEQNQRIAKDIDRFSALIGGMRGT